MRSYAVSFASEHDESIYTAATEEEADQIVKNLILETGCDEGSLENDDAEELRRLCDSDLKQALSEYHDHFDERNIFVCEVDPEVTTVYVIVQDCSTKTHDEWNVEPVVQQTFGFFIDAEGLADAETQVSELNGNYTPNDEDDDPTPYRVMELKAA
jgi:hypothetical protein